jgi:sporulation protein YunB
MKQRRGRRIRAVAVLLVLLLIAAVVLFDRTVRSTAANLCEARVDAAASRAMHEAVLEVLSEQNGEALLKVYAQNGRAYLLETDSVRLNRLAADCAIRAQDRIAALGEQGALIPLGTALGVSILNGFGPKLRVRFTPTGTVRASCESSFRSAGINQTVHRIVLSLTATVRIQLPGGAQTVEVCLQTPVSEDIVIGDVPDTYADVDRPADAMDLIP